MQQKLIKVVEKKKNNPGQYEEDSILKMLLKDIRRTPLLSREEEYRLAVRVRKHGDLAARNQLIQANLRFVVNIAKKYLGTGMPLTDLFNEGSIGLIEAANKFDPDRGYHFISYAVWWVRQRIMLSIPQNSFAYHVPTNQIADINKIQKFKEKYYNEHNREATEAEVAEGLAMKLEKVKKMEKVSRTGFSSTIYLEDIKKPEESKAWLETIADEKQPEVIEKLVNDELIERLDKYFNKLKPRDKMILSLRYGLDLENKVRTKRHTYSEIARILKIQKEIVRQRIHKGLNDLRRDPEFKEFEMYLLEN